MFQKESAAPSSKLALAVAVAAELGEGADRALEALDAALQKQPNDADLRYEAARAFSLASKAISRTDVVAGRRLAGRSLGLLREAVKNDGADFGKMDQDVDLDPIREEPAFAEIMKAGHTERRYSAVWSSDARFEAIPIFGLEPAAHLEKCRQLIAQDYRPASWSAMHMNAEGTLVTASVWHRPVISEEAKDRLAESQARAAIALVRTGKAEEVWPLLRHSADPRLRSFIVNWLSPLGALPGAVAGELARLESASPASPRAALRGERGDSMDAILLDRETSTRRALIQALATFDVDGLDALLREPLEAKLLDLYQNDPDAGIHSAAEWALRKWGQQDKLKEIDARLMKVKDRSNRRWFINGLGQTFTVIEGPVAFRMGSPSTEIGRNESMESPRSMVIPRRFAIATKEVTKEQWQRFLRANPELEMPAGFVNKWSPDPDGPIIGISWYIAAGFSNWLSEQEGLPQQEWCYLPNKAGAYAEGMSIPADVLEHRLSVAHGSGMGIRLPCRHLDEQVSWQLDYAARRLCTLSNQQQRSFLDVREPAFKRPGAF